MWNLNYKTTVHKDQLDPNTAIIKNNKKKPFKISQTNKKVNKKHSENADTSLSVTFDLDVWPWPYFKDKIAYVIRCRLLYCVLVPGMMSVNIIVCEIWPLILFFVTFDLHLWPSAYVNVTFTLFSRCILCSYTLVPNMKFVCLMEFEIWTIVYRKLKWRHNDVITHSNLIKFKHKSTKSISKWQTEFHSDRT